MVWANWVAGVAGVLRLVHAVRLYSGRNLTPKTRAFVSHSQDTPSRPAENADANSCMWAAFSPFHSLLTTHGEKDANAATSRSKC